MANHKERVWELDALRGLFLLCMIGIHAVFDLQYFLQLDIRTSAVFDFIQNNGGILFIVISGICATLGTRFLKRGLLVMACGGLISAVTWAMTQVGMADDSIIIYWGVLHLLGFCMIFYGILRHLPSAMLVVLAAAFIAVGFWIGDIHPQTASFCFLGLTPDDFATSDFFPVFPYTGWFIFGIFLGRLLYKEKRTLLPRFPSRLGVIRFLSFCGRHSLWIYLLHQPIVYGTVMGLSYLLQR